MRNSSLVFILFTTLVALKILKCSCNQNKVFYFSLDERFATRGMFLNLAELIKSDFDLLTPPIEFISHYKTPANLTLIDEWLQNEINICNETKCLFVISSEMFIYGGLINSRISNETLDNLINRLNKLQQYKQLFKNNIKFYFSNVIMRIPAYNGDFEEPWYWSDYGYLMYLWSYYLDKYYVLNNESDYETAYNISKQIPENALNEFIWRRNRNNEFTFTVFNYQNQFSLFEKIWITLDDNSEYGLNRYEERNIRNVVANLNLNESVNIYPGADEVGLVMLAKSIADIKNQLPKIKVVYRNDTNKDSIPNYEGQPLNMSILSQINAAGGFLSNDSNYDMLLLVNNWSTDQQHEASEVQVPQDYSIFENYANFEGFIIFADVFYSNGGDKYFFQWLKNSQFKSKFGMFTYAGWNTAGNTIGTCISNGVLLFVYNSENINDNKLFTHYRFLEDLTYQACVRQYLLNYLNYVSYDNLINDFNFYENFVLKGFQASLLDNEVVFENKSNAYKVNNVYYPWNRTFEIGFTIFKNTM